MSGNLEKDLDNIIAKMIEATKETVTYAEQVTKGYAPVKTGYLQSQIKAESVDQYSFKLESNAEYSLFVNNGTTKMPANPFFSRGVEDSYQKWIENLKGAMKK